jgi:hypothetical protein
VTGDEAAALGQLKGSIAALKRLVPGWGLNKGVTIDTIKEYERLYALTAPYAPADEQPALLVKAVEADFANRKGRLTTALKSTDVSVNGKPSDPAGGYVSYRIPDKNQDINKVQQGQAGDCTFLATTIGMVNSRGEGASPSVRIGVNVDPKNTKDDYAVNFNGAKYEVRIKKPTQSEIALYANAQDNGLWLSIMEKAYAQVRKQNYDDFFGGFFSKDAYRVLDGQSLKDGMKIVTRNDPAAYLTGNKLTEAAVEKQLKAVMATADPQTGFGKLRVIVTAATPNDPTWKGETTKLIPGHAYAVIGYNVKTKELTIVNPWNNPAYTYGTTFTMKLDVFVKNYGALCVESRLGVNRN